MLIFIRDFLGFILQNYRNAQELNDLRENVKILEKENRRLRETRDLTHGLVQGKDQVMWDPENSNDNAYCPACCGNGIRQVLIKEIGQWNCPRNGCFATYFFDGLPPNYDWYRAF